MIWGYHYFRKHPYERICEQNQLSPSASQKAKSLFGRPVVSNLSPPEEAPGGENEETDVLKTGGSDTENHGFL